MYIPWQYDKSTANIKYCIYRVSTCILFFVAWIFTYLKEPAAGKPRWPIYLTNWGFTLCMLQSFLNSIMIVVTLIAERSAGKSQWKEKILKLYPTYWVINVMATPVAFTISIIYWTLIFGAEGASFTPMNFIVHGLNSIIMLLDVCIVSYPVKVFHFIYPLFLAFYYTIFTVSFYYAGGTTKTGSRYIYPILKWDQPGQTMGVCAGVMVLMIILHIVTFLVYKLRIKIHNRFFLPKIDPPLPEKDQNAGQHAYANKAMANEYV
ncbi:hypothetical protein YQE_06706, partial [Dendroctonus ponderosae]